MTTLFLTATAPENASDAISIEAAVMILLTGGLLYCFKAIAELRRQLEQRTRGEAARLASATRAAPPSSTASDSTAAAAATAPHVLAAIAAAVHYVMGPNHRVCSVVPAPLPGGERWSVEGRREVFQSHQLR